MTDTENVKQKIINEYLGFIASNNHIPSYADLLDLGIDRNKIRSQFGNLTKLHQFINTTYREQLDKHIAHADHIFNEKRLASIRETFSTTRVFIVTTSVVGKKVDQNLLNSIRSYLQARNGQLIILASEDIASRDSVDADGVFKWRVDKSLRNDYFVRDEVQLNSNLFVSNIKVSAKQILPTTGLSRIGQINGSYIFASPKQMLEFVATSAKQTYPKAIMTTGAITVADYRHDKWMSQRTSYIAEHDHVMGGIIVEIVDDKMFHFRQFQANQDGEFIDLGVRYKPDGTTEQVTTHLYAGDLHAGQEDTTAFNATMDMCEKLNIENFIVGDFFDGYSISHHHINSPTKMAMKANYGLDSLKEELSYGGSLADTILNHIQGDLVMVRGNHDEVLEKYLLAGNYIRDYKNQYVALGLTRSLLENKDPLPEAYMMFGHIQQFDRIVWLNRDDQYVIGGVECGQHGDLGANGSKGSLGSLEKAYGNCIVGHAHSGAIFRGVYRVGTLTKLALEYNRGPSSWTHTNCLIYPDGSRQLVNIVNGTYRLDRET